MEVNSFTCETEWKCCEGLEVYQVKTQTMLTGSLKCSMGTKTLYEWVCLEHAAVPSGGFVHASPPGGCFVFGLASNSSNLDYGET